MKETRGRRQIFRFQIADIKSELNHSPLEMTVMASVIDVAVAFRLMEKTRGDEMQGKLLEIVKMLYKLK